MRVAIASSGLGHVNRGIEAWAADLARALKLRGVDVLLCKGAGPVVEERERVVGCWRREEPRTAALLQRMPRALGWRLGVGGPYQIEQTTFAFHLLPILRREQIDLLHLQDPQLALIIQRASQLRLVRTRVILGHGTEEPLSFIRKIQYLQHLAPWHLEQARTAGVWRPTWTAIPNFIDTDQFTPLGPDLRQELDIPSDALVVLVVAAIKRHHKRVDYLIEEFAKLRQRYPELPAWLVVAGGWEQETDELVRWGKERLEGRVRFLVKFPRHRMPSLYRTADVFVLCSLLEMMPIALIEATASGLPCIVNRHPVMEWMAGPGGVAIDMSVPGALCDELSRALGDLNSRKSMGERARRHCLDNFGREPVVDQIIEYYRFVLSQPDRAT